MDTSLYEWQSISSEELNNWLKVTYPNYIQTPGEEFRNE